MVSDYLNLAFKLQYKYSYTIVLEDSLDLVFAKHVIIQIYFLIWILYRIIGNSKTFYELRQQ